MREIVHIQAGQCGNQIGAKVCMTAFVFIALAGFLDGGIMVAHWRRVWAYLIVCCISFIALTLLRNVCMSYT